MTRQGHYGNRLGPITTHSSIMAQIFQLAQSDGIYLKDICNNAPKIIGNWRRGDHHPSILKAESILDRLGYEIIIRKKGPHHE